MDNAVDANNSRANLREGTGGERGTASTHRREKNGGVGSPSLKKQFPGRKEVRLALGHQRAHGQVCTGRKVVISTIVRKWDCGRGPLALWSLPSLERGRGGRESLGNREGREQQPALPPFVPARGGCLSRCLLCRLLALALPRRRRRRRRRAGARHGGEREREGGRSGRRRPGCRCPPLPAEPQGRRENVKNKIK